jgi:vacuolar-type H+-ATPase subunit H
MTAKLNFKTDLDSYLNPDLKTVNGDGRLITQSVGIKDSKVFNLLGTAAKNESLKNPTIKNVNLGFRIKDGNVEIDSTALNLAGQDANFYGTIGLDESLDMKVGMSLSETVANSLLSKAVGGEKAGMIKVTADIGGTVNDPKIKGFSTSATDALKDLAQEKIQEVKDKVSDEAKKLIADAKAQGDKLIAEAKKQKENLVSAAKATSEQAKKAAQETRDKAVAAAKEEAQKAVSKASNPIAKAAAQKAADKTVAEAEKKADKALSEANAKADSSVAEAEKQGDKLVSEAQKKADQLNAEAVKKAESIK